MSKRYIVSYQLPEIEKDEKALTAFINNNRYVEKWNHPYAGLFMISSDEEKEDVLFDSLMEYFSELNVQAIFLEVTGKYCAGILPSQSWEWFDQFNSDAEK